MQSLMEQSFDQILSGAAPGRQTVNNRFFHGVAQRPFVRVKRPFAVVGFGGPDCSGASTGKAALGRPLEDSTRRPTAAPTPSAQSASMSTSSHLNSPRLQGLAKEHKAVRRMEHRARRSTGARVLLRSTAVPPGRGCVGAGAARICSARKRPATRRPTSLSTRQFGTLCRRGRRARHVRLTWSQVVGTNSLKHSRARA